MGKTGKSMTGTSNTQLAPAKLTVSLRMTGVRPDGYHLIDAEMVSLDLADTLTFHDAATTAMTSEGTAHSPSTRFQ